MSWMPATTPWLELSRGRAPLLVTFPHTGTELPPAIEARLCSRWLAQKDADHWVHHLYDFVHALGATTLRTQLSRSVIDVNRDPTGASLYPGQSTTELCPLTTFDGEALYRPGCEPDTKDIAERRAAYFAPYHLALANELARLRARHACVVLLDAHSIRSSIPRLFEGTLPELNIGSYDDRASASELVDAVQAACARSQFSWVRNGRFKGGWTTRHYGKPSQGTHAVQLELACRSYMHEPELPNAENWPPAYDPVRAAALRRVLTEVVQACLDFALRTARSQA